MSLLVPPSVNDRSIPVVTETSVLAPRPTAGVRVNDRSIPVVTETGVAPVRRHDEAECQ